MEVLRIKPLSNALVDVDAFAEYREQAKKFGTRKKIVLEFPEWVKMRTCRGRGWRSNGRSREVTVETGYIWDGPTGAFDTPPLRLSSLVHDIICELTANGYVVNGYFVRHWIYWKIARYQGAGLIRPTLHLGILILANWLYAILSRIGGKNG